MQTLVVGRGFIADALIHGLLKAGHRVSVFQRQGRPLMDEVETYFGDLEDEFSVAAAVEQSNPEIVFHLAADKDRSQSLTGLHKALTVNLLGTCSLLTACAQVSTLKLLVVMGTTEEYGDTPFTPFQETQRERPITNYSLSKTCQTYLCETMARIHDLPVVILRPSIVYGPGQGIDMFVPSLICSLLQSQRFKMTLGAQKRDFIFIEDIIDLLLTLTGPQDVAGEVINLGYGHSVSLSYIAEFVAEKTGSRHLLDLGAVAYRRGEIFNYQVNIEKAQRLLSWTPAVSLETGLLKTLAHYQKVLAR